MLLVRMGKSGAVEGSLMEDFLALDRKLRSDEDRLSALMIRLEVDDDLESGKFLRGSWFKADVSE